MGAQWLGGRVLDSRLRDRGLKPHWRHCVVSLRKNRYPSLVLVQPRKIHPHITERLLMGRKGLNQTKSNISDEIELNPGPYYVHGSADTSDILSSASFDSLTNHLSLRTLHLNIQSILPKIDLIRGEATSYDILIFQKAG